MSSLNMINLDHQCQYTYKGPYFYPRWGSGFSETEPVSFYSDGIIKVWLLPKSKLICCMVSAHFLALF